MDKLAIINSVALQLQATIDSFEKSIAELDGTADMDESETRDPEDYSQQSESTDMKMRLKLQLQKVQQELNLLESYRKVKSDVVGPGVVFETAQKIFLVGVYVNGVEHEGQPVVCLSTDAPIYNLVVNKKVGDSFTLGETPYQILDLA